MWPRHVMMVTPKFFDITYAINPHMIDKAGRLKRIDKALASDQWHTLKEKFESLGVVVSVVDGKEHLPDMVFCANPLFPFLKKGRTQFVCSNMSSRYRRTEVDHVADCVTRNNHEVYKLPETFRFEGMGDALWNYDTGEIYGGYGFRTEKEAYDHIEDITGASVVRLKLINESFYHLDTALCIVDKKTAIVVREAFSDESLEKIKMKFLNIIWAPVAEAHNYLAANACSVDGYNVLVEKNAINLRTQLQLLGYRTHTIDTSEFLKAGGSIFCMKLQLWDAIHQPRLSFVQPFAI